MRYCIECGCLLDDNHDGDVCECCQDERAGTTSDGVRVSGGGNY